MYLRLLTAVSILLVVSVPVITSSGTDGPVVHVPGGSIVGRVDKSAGGRSFHAFKGVPYAANPDGKLKFKPPQPVEPWTVTRDATKVGPVCAQSGRGFTRGEIDCLHLSVYAPQLPEGSSRKLPVLVWLHGGAFILSGADAYDPGLLMDKDIVIVVPQYRLGIYGFHFAKSDSPGNYGMLDQVAALRWVRDNIATFGGDPDRVTLGGDCAGGASALYHMISPLSKDLFHGVISLSGSPINPWAKQMLDIETRLLFAGPTDCPDDDSTAAMTECFRKVTLENMLKAQTIVLDGIKNVPELMYVGNNNQAPIVQKKEHTDPAYNFLPEEPVVAFAEGNFAKVPVLLMSSKDEGNYLIDMLVHEWAEEQAKIYEEFMEDVVSMVAKATGLNMYIRDDLKMVWQEYFADMEFTPYEGKIPALAKLLSDSVYNAGIMYNAKCLNDKVPTYLFRFDYEDGPHYNHFNTTAIKRGLAAPHGAAHLDPLYYFIPYRVQTFAKDEHRQISDTLINMIDTFVNTGSPGPSFTTTTDEGLETTVIGQDGSILQDTFLDTNRQKLATMIVNHHHRSPMGYLEMQKRKRDEL